MSQTHQIKAYSRQDQGKGASRRLRQAGLMPAVVYGGGQDPQSIQIEHNTVFLAARHEWFFSSILDLDIDGKIQKVLVRDWQKHPYKQLMMHLDFLRVSDQEVLRTNVPLHFLNQDTSVAAKTSGLVISHNLTEVEVACLPKDLPEFLEIDLADLKPGDIIHLSQITLPAGIEITALQLGADHDAAVVTTNMVQEEVAAAPEAEDEEGKK